MSFSGERLKNVRENREISVAQLANHLGIGEQAVYKYESGIVTNVPLSRVESMAKYLNVSPSYLMGWTDDEIIEKLPNLHPIRHIRKVPILGTITCSSPMWIKENFEGYLRIDPAVMDGDFALCCKGDSMVGAEIYDGDLALLKKTDYVENGKIAAVYFDGEATLNKVYSYPDKEQIILQPCNPEYSPIIYNKDDMEFDRPIILGELVGVYQYRN